MRRLEEKIAIITGGNSGIGKATAKLFCKEGAKVVIASRRAENNQKTVEEITALGGDILAVQADVSNQEDCLKIINKSIEKYGKVDILVNNAGMADKHMPITHCTEEHYKRICLVDQFSIFYMTKYVLPYMEKNKSGSIINISSIGSHGIAGISYSAAKGAVDSMTKNVALQYSPTNIRCNAVAPGPTPTEIWSSENREGTHEEFAAACAKHIDTTLPTATVEDQAEAILFFASDASRAITGQILYVDHGTTLY